MVKQSKDQILAPLVLLSQIWYFSLFLFSWLFLGDFHDAGLAFSLWDIFGSFQDPWNISKPCLEAKVLSLGFKPQSSYCKFLGDL
jgi:hypothetical protein